MRNCLPQGTYLNKLRLLNIICALFLLNTLVTKSQTKKYASTGSTRITWEPSSSCDGRPMAIDIEWKLRIFVGSPEYHCKVTPHFTGNYAYVDGVKHTFSGVDSKLLNLLKLPGVNDILATNLGDFEFKIGAWGATGFQPFSIEGLSKEKLAAMVKNGTRFQNFKVAKCPYFSSLYQLKSALRKKEKEAKSKESAVSGTVSSSGAKTDNSSSSSSTGVKSSNSGSSSSTGAKSGSSGSSSSSSNGTSGQNGSSYSSGNSSSSNANYAAALLQKQKIEQDLYRKRDEILRQQQALYNKQKTAIYSKAGEAIGTMIANAILEKERKDAIKQQKRRASEEIYEGMKKELEKELKKHERDAAYAIDLETEKCYLKWVAYYSNSLKSLENQWRNNYYNLWSPRLPNNMPEVQCTKSYLTLSGEDYYRVALHKKEKNDKTWQEAAKHYAEKALKNGSAGKYAYLMSTFYDLSNAQTKKKYLEQALRRDSNHQKAKEELTFVKAYSSKNTQGLEEYCKKYPSGTYKKQAVAELEDLLSTGRFAEAVLSGNYAEAVKQEQILMSADVYYPHEIKKASANRKLEKYVRKRYSKNPANARLLEQMMKKEDPSYNFWRKMKMAGIKQHFGAAFVNAGKNGMGGRIRWMGYRGWGFYGGFNIPELVEGNFFPDEFIEKGEKGYNGTFLRKAKDISLNVIPSGGITTRIYGNFSIYGGVAIREYEQGDFYSSPYGPYITNHKEGMEVIPDFGIEYRYAIFSFTMGMQGEQMCWSIGLTGFGYYF